VKRRFCLFHNKTMVSVAGRMMKGGLRIFVTDKPGRKMGRMDSTGDRTKNRTAARRQKGDLISSRGVLSRRRPDPGSGRVKHGHHHQAIKESRCGGAVNARTHFRGKFNSSSLLFFPL
jgi:hypothetical protein